MGCRKKGAKERYPTKICKRSSVSDAFKAGMTGDLMKLKVIVHEAEEGGYWAEVPSIPGCATQGETFDELLRNIYEAVEGCLSIDLDDVEITEKDKVLEIAV
jgi:predicted RNase H-like HicB family nuclease